MKVLFIVLFGLISQSLMAECPTMNFPDSFTIKEKAISIDNEFTIESNSQKVGTIEETIISLTTEFTLKNASGNKVAVAKKRLISWGSIVDIYDCQGNKLGLVEEKIIESMFSIKTHYKVVDSKTSEVSQSEMLSFFTTNIDIKHNGSPVISMKRDMINLLSDTWSVKMSAKNVNPLLLIMIPAFKTNSDNEKEEKKKNNKRSK